MDGYRAIAVIDSTGKARIWSRNRLSLEQKFPNIRDAEEELNLRSTILDGEIVAQDDEGIPRFQLLQKWQNVQLRRLICFGIEGPTWPARALFKAGSGWRKLLLPWTGFRSEATSRSGEQRFPACEGERIRRHYRKAEDQCLPTRKTLTPIV
jgi:ATP dependent DNA ligase-like protein